jgi:hypothetical protein|tara:strand:+ start:94 stop:423 length:330 start_codon:yes stop_codon:yes gene_type:complete
MSRYAMAHVKLPIEIKPDKSIRCMQEHAHVFVDSLIGSLEEIESLSAPDSLQVQIERLLGEETAKIEENEIQITISKDEIKPRLYNQVNNRTFKRRPSKQMLRKTAKAS